jgi:hypothetical protein
MIAKRASLLLLAAPHSPSAFLSLQCSHLQHDCQLMHDPVRKSTVLKQTQLIERMAQMKVREEEIEKRRQERISEQEQAEAIMSSAMQLLQSQPSSTHTTHSTVIQTSS